MLQFEVDNADKEVLHAQLGLLLVLGNVFEVLAVLSDNLVDLDDGLLDLVPEPVVQPELVLLPNQALEDSELVVNLFIDAKEVVLALVHLN